MSLLSSLRILDFSTLLPGPYATLVLADLGAEVLRIESPTRPDLTRCCHRTMRTAAGSYTRTSIVPSVPWRSI